MEITITIKIDDHELMNFKEEQTQKETIREASQYARFFDEGSSKWERDPEYNLMFLKAQQHYANDLLKAKGCLFLNEVYDMLGIPRSKTGQIVGWIYDKDNPSGDNYVDFGIHEDRNKDFVNGLCNEILLDFNVDGNILEHL